MFRPETTISRVPARIRRLLALGAAAMVGLVPLAAAGAPSGKLVLYTSQPNTDAQQTIDAFRKRYPDVQITFVRDGTPRLVAKIRAEIAAGSPQADILLLAENVTMAALKAEGRLMPVPDAQVAPFPAELNDPDRTWFATKLITTGIAYNTKAPFKPASWDDLVRPETKGQVVMPSPLNSGAALIHAASLTGSLPEGWGFYEQLRKGGAVAGGGNGDVLKSLAGGEKLYGMLVDFMAIREAAKGAPIAFVFPKEGVSAVTEPVAVMKTTQNAEAARAFVAFLLSREGQELAAAQGYVPADPAVPLPAGFPPRSAIKLLPFDPAALARSEKETRAKFSDIFEQ